MIQASSAAASLCNLEPNVGKRRTSQTNRLQQIDCGYFGILLSNHFSFFAFCRETNPKIDFPAPGPILSPRIGSFPAKSRQDRRGYRRAGSGCRAQTIDGFHAHYLRCCLKSCRARSREAVFPLPIRHRPGLAGPTPRPAAEANGKAPGRWRMVNAGGGGKRRNCSKKIRAERNGQPDPIRL